MLLRRIRQRLANVVSGLPRRPALDSATVANGRHVLFFRPRGCLTESTEMRVAGLWLVLVWPLTACRKTPETTFARGRDLRLEAVGWHFWRRLTDAGPTGGPDSADLGAGGPGLTSGCLTAVVRLVAGRACDVPRRGGGGATNDAETAYGHRRASPTRRPRTRPAGAQRRFGQAEVSAAVRR